jgi:hypothetical protein
MASAGLAIRAKLDRKRYPKGIKVSDQELAQLNLTPAEFHGSGTIVLLLREIAQVIFESFEVRSRVF